jgi:hypothetical protein
MQKLYIMTRAPPTATATQPPCNIVIIINIKKEMSKYRDRKNNEYLYK